MADWDIILIEPDPETAEAWRPLAAIRDQFWRDLFPPLPPQREHRSASEFRAREEAFLRRWSDLLQSPPGE